MKKRYTEKNRIVIRIAGTVQGVGFRPFVFHLATNLGLFGFVTNGAEGVLIHAEGKEDALKNFLARLVSEIPPLAKIEKISHQYFPPSGFKQFEIVESDTLGEKTVLVMPDIKTCPDCLREIFDPADRRYRYPFTNCTNCGPRFTIVEDVPYDRARTSMKHFPMCPECKAEYKDPENRRFHAEPTACPVCGPRLELWEQNGKVTADRGEALFIAETILWNGGVIALKGLGGFQIIADARNKESVSRLRTMKGRPEEKPFALMYQDIEGVRRHCAVSQEEEKLLLSRESPIVLLRRKKNTDKNSPCAEVAPKSDTLGVMLPYTPLHHLFLCDLGFPIVATSGNISDEPIETNENEAVRTIGKMCDALLVHNRGIVRHADDSIARVISKKPVIMRRARGYVPLPIAVDRAPKDVPCVIAFGSHLKNTGAVLIGDMVFLTQHQGDMETVKSAEALERSISDILVFREKIPELVVCDAHPNYVSTRMAKRFADEFGIPLLKVQHHEAHALSCMAENNILHENVFAAAWDGTGFGTDEMSWGGEFFRIAPKKISRVSHLRPFALIGGDAAAREPKRVATAMLWEIFGDKIFSDEKFAPIRDLSELEKKMFPVMLSRKTGIHFTTSIGRLFDAVASLLDICHSSSYEGHAAMMLEQAIGKTRTGKTYELVFLAEGLLDWRPIIRDILRDANAKISAGIISTKFHNTLAKWIALESIASREKKIVLSGGCFQNKYLTETTIRYLREASLTPIFHRFVPTNDGGIALGQIAAALRFFSTQKR